jgi:hypothetical protein
VKDLVLNNQQGASFISVIGMAGAASLLILTIISMNAITQKSNRSRKVAQSVDDFRNTMNNVVWDPGFCSAYFSGNLVNPNSTSPINVTLPSGSAPAEYSSAFGGQLKAQSLPTAGTIIDGNLEITTLTLAKTANLHPGATPYYLDSTGTTYIWPFQGTVNISLQNLAVKNKTAFGPGSYSSQFNGNFVAGSPNPAGPWTIVKCIEPSADGSGNNYTKKGWADPTTDCTTTTNSATNGDIDCPAGTYASEITLKSMQAITNTQVKSYKCCKVPN